MTELLNCPFCGGSVMLIPVIGDWYECGEPTGYDSYKWSIHHNAHSGCKAELHDYAEFRTLDCKEADEQKQRLIAAWNTRAERTCENVGYYIDNTRFKCSACGYNGWTKWAKDGRDRAPNYCPNCGFKIRKAVKHG